MVRNIPTRRQRTSRGRYRDRNANRRTGNNPRQGSDHRDGGLWTNFPVHNKRMDKDGRWDGSRLSRRGAVERYGNGPVPPYPIAEYRHSNHGSRSRGRRSPGEQGWRTLPQTVRPEQDGTRSPRYSLKGRDERDQRGQRIRGTLRQLREPRPHTPRQNNHRGQTTIRKGALREIPRNRP